MSEIKLVPIEELKEADWNPKNFSETLLRKLEESIKYENGYGVLAVRRINNQYEVIDGNHRLRVLKRLNYKEVWIEDFGEIDFRTAYLIFWQRNQLWNPINYQELFELVDKHSMNLKELEKTIPVPSRSEKVRLPGKDEYVKLLIGLDEELYNALSSRGNPKEVIMDILREIKENELARPG